MKTQIRKLISRAKLPNSWGRQDYAGKALPLIKNKSRDKSRPNGLLKMAFVQRIMTMYVTGYTRKSI